MSEIVRRIGFSKEDVAITYLSNSIARKVYTHFIFMLYFIYTHDDHKKFSLLRFSAGPPPPNPIFDYTSRAKCSLKKYDFQGTTFSCY